jgi:hypothetical protein
LESLKEIGGPGQGNQQRPLSSEMQKHKCKP